MCCNYCYYFKECKKAKKISSNCCQDCAESEFCPFILSEKSAKDCDALADGGSDLDLLDSGGEF